MASGRPDTWRRSRRAFGASGSIIMTDALHAVIRASSGWQYGGHRPQAQERAPSGGHGEAEMCPLLTGTERQRAAMGAGGLAGDVEAEAEALGAAAAAFAAEEGAEQRLLELRRNRAALIFDREGEAPILHIAFHEDRRGRMPVFHSIGDEVRDQLTHTAAIAADRAIALPFEFDLVAGGGADLVDHLLDFGLELGAGLDPEGGLLAEAASGEHEQIVDQRIHPADRRLHQPDRVHGALALPLALEHTEAGGDRRDRAPKIMAKHRDEFLAPARACLLGVELAPQPVRLFAILELPPD